MDTVVEEVDVGRWRLEIERPKDADALIDEARFDECEFLPYWAELWPSGVALARAVASRALGGRTVLELGCGLGVPSITAARAGARVFATDWAPEALRLVAANAHRNGVVVRPLHVDWRAPEAIGDRRFDLVLAADVLYEERNAAPLARLLGDIVARDGAALVADPGRRHAARFLAIVAEGGWSRDTMAVEELPRGGIHRLWRKRITIGAHP